MSNAKSRSKKVKGGAGSADYVIAKFGNMGEQHALSGSNVIAPKMEVAAPMTGGADAVMDKTVHSPAPFVGGKRKGRKTMSKGKKSNKTRKYRRR